MACVPFVVTHKLSLDDELPHPDTDIDHKISFKSFKKASKCSYVLSSEKTVDLIQALVYHFHSCASHCLASEPVLCQILHDVDPGQLYHVKVVNTPSYRFMYTSLKDILMQNKLFTSQWEDIKGEDIVMKPVFCCPLWNGQKWKFVMITEYAPGESLNHTRKFFNKLVKPYNKKIILANLEKAVSSMWLLGFSHNDLSDYNIIIDRKTNKIKIIDFETSVQLPENDKKHFQDLYKFLDVSDLYNKLYQKNALTLLKTAEKCCCKFIVHSLDGKFMEIAEYTL